MIGQIPRKELQKIGNYRDTFYDKEEERMMKIDARQLAEKEQAMEDKQCVLDNLKLLKENKQTLKSIWY